MEANHGWEQAWPLIPGAAWHHCLSDSAGPCPGTPASWPGQLNQIFLRGGKELEPLWELSY